jgi:hypothetical protein
VELVSAESTFFVYENTHELQRVELVSTESTFFVYESTHELHPLDLATPLHRPPTPPSHTLHTLLHATLNASKAATNCGA